MSDNSHDPGITLNRAMEFYGSMQFISYRIINHRRQEGWTEKCILVTGIDPAHGLVTIFQGIYTAEAMGVALRPPCDDDDPEEFR